MKKLNKKGGFTLVEMLIVVAIIAILIAISIPLVNNALEKAKDATDDSNFRSAIALGTIKFLTEGEDADGSYWYVAAGTGNTQGTLSDKLTETNTPSGTGPEYKSQCTATGSETHGDTKTSSGKYILVTIDHTQSKDTDIVKAAWAASYSAG